MKVDVKIPKCKGQFLEFDTDKVVGSDHKNDPNSEEGQSYLTVMKYIIQKGVESIINRGGLSKISVVGLEGAELEGAEAAAKEIVEKNLAALYKGEIRMVGVRKTKGGDRAVTAEARRIARDLVKQELRRQNLKPSHYSAKAITEAADEYISEHPEITEQAKDNLKKKEDIATTVKFDVSKMAPDPKLVAKAESKKKKDKVPLSAKQASRVH